MSNTNSVDKLFKKTRLSLQQGHKLRKPSRPAQQWTNRNRGDSVVVSDQIFGENRLTSKTLVEQQQAEAVSETHNTPRLYSIHVRLDVPKKYRQHRTTVGRKPR